MEENTVNAVVEEVVTPQTEEVQESVTSEVATESAPQSKEENTKFAEIRRKYEAEKQAEVQKAIDAEYERMYGQYGIKNKAEYEEAIKKQREAEELEQLKTERNYSDEEASEILEARRIKAEYEAQQAKSKEEQALRQQNLEFLDYFAEINGRAYDGKKDIIPQDVWDKVATGMPLKYAYMDNQLKQLKIGTKTADKNAENAKASLGSLTSDSAVDTDFVSKELFEQKRSNQDWVKKNLDKIIKSRSSW